MNKPNSLVVTTTWGELKGDQKSAYVDLVSELKSQVLPLYKVGDNYSFSYEELTNKLSGGDVTVKQVELKLSDVLDKAGFMDVSEAKDAKDKTKTVNLINDMKVTIDKNDKNEFDASKVHFGVTGAYKDDATKVKAALNKAKLADLYTTGTKNGAGWWFTATIKGDAPKANANNAYVIKSSDLSNYLK